MSRLSAWLEQCSTLWKARKPADLNALAQQMDETLGPWSEGNRADAIKHVERIGRRAATTMRGAVPGTPEHDAHRFMMDLYRLNTTKRTSHAILPSGDTLKEPADKAHIAHYGNQWADHFDTLSRATNTNGAISKRARMIGPQHVITSHDLGVLSAGVSRAVHLGRVSTEGANRFHVMHQALKVAEQRHPESYPGTPFKPSYAALDTGALETMRVGAEHVHEMGFSADKERLTSVLDSAIAAHKEHPFAPRSTKYRPRVIAGYPSLHPIGSDAHRKQGMSIALRNAALDRRHETPAPKAPKATPVSAAEASPKFAEPTSWDEYKQRQESGEDFESHFKRDPGLRSRMEGLNPRRQKVQKAFDAQLLLRSWYSWREEAL